MQTKAIIVEDVPAARDELQAMLATECPDIRIVGVADSCAKGLDLIKTVAPDLVFLDVELPDGDSFDILRQLKNPDMAVVFITGHSHHAFRAFEFSAVDYLLKPISPSRLSEAVRRATDAIVLRRNHERYEILLTLLNNKEATNQTLMEQRIALSNQEIIVFPRLREIIHLNSVRVYTEVFMENFSEPIIIAKNLGEYAQLFQDVPCIMRIHRSHIVNLQHVQRFIREDSQVLITGGRKLDVAQAHKDTFLKRWRECT